ncbi:PrsW family intramembrane metalloprotease [Streptomyces orinoci]|uniref:PrsW family glutamic-type intramembrane protease n=1 Tax=Streptomyces orinoci TaxID=67339 RepID=A0ABV3JS88_STRON|nr:PrsW family glutamic-type intramembrane protease [Streptomyces orinoci]
MWLRCLTAGLALWVSAVLVTAATHNSRLLPTVILLGSFLAPGCFVLWAQERYGRRRAIGLLPGCFLVGGVLGVLGASVLEHCLLHPSMTLFAGVGLIEEGVKALALVWLLRGHPRTRGPRTGLVLGAAVGFGFAAFESAGYAFNALIADRDLSLRALIETEVLRGLLAPFGHGLWTAILGGALLAARHHGRFRLTERVIACYAGVSLLHALWDAMNDIAGRLVRLLAADPMPGGQEQERLRLVLSNAGLLAVALTGVAWLASLVRSTGGASVPRS